MKDIDAMMQEAGREPAGVAKEEVKDTPTEAQVEKQEVVTTEQPKVENKEDVPANDEKPKTEEQPSNEFDISLINKAFGKNFESKEDLEKFFSIPDEYQSTKARLEELEKTLGEKDEKLKQQFNPRSYFASEQQFKINKILTDNPDLNDAIVTRLVKSNVDELSDKDVLKLNDMISTKGTFDEAIVAMDIDDRYGLNVNKEDLEDDELKRYQVKEYRMKKDAEKARDELKKIANVELPEYKDPDVLAKEKNEEQQKLFNDNKSKWQNYANDFVDKFTKMDITYKSDGEDKTFEFEVDKEFLSAVQKNMPEIAARAGKDLSKPEDVQAITDMVKKDFLWLRKDVIIKNAIEDTISKMTKEEIDKYHNPSKPKTEEAPKTLSNEERFNAEQKKKMLDQEIKYKR